jgi:hypothetical protein
MVARYPNSSPRVLAKLAPKASYGSGARRSPGYGFVVVLEAEASVTQAALKQDDQLQDTTDGVCKKVNFIRQKSDGYI